MLVDCRIFEAMFPDEWTEDEQHLAAMTETTEESFSAEFLARCSKRDEYFGPDGAPASPCSAARADASPFRQGRSSTTSPLQSPTSPSPFFFAVGPRSARTPPR